jgi:hypothetical protein
LALKIACAPLLSVNIEMEKESGVRKGVIGRWQDGWNASRACGMVRGRPETKH